MNAFDRCGAHELMALRALYVIMYVLELLLELLSSKTLSAPSIHARALKNLTSIELLRMQYFLGGKFRNHI